ncbi:MAG TPA: hypothetical protein VIW48_01505 [Nitrospiraceae bacterium]
MPSLIAKDITELKNITFGLTEAAYKILTLSNLIAAAGILGSLASALSGNQPALNALFGGAKGATISLAAIAISHAASTIVAYGPALGASSPHVVVTQAEHINIGVPAAATTPGVNVTTTETVPPVS